MTDYTCDACESENTRLVTRARENFDPFNDDHPWNDSTQVVGCRNCGNRWPV